MPTSIADLHFDLQVDYASRRIAIRGEFDLATIPHLADTIFDLHRAGTGDITIDLAEVAFMDAAGLGALVTAKATQRDRGDTLAVVRATPAVRRLFVISRLTELLHD
jgi:anti-sigma B factor antagonist